MRTMSLPDDDDLEPASPAPVRPAFRASAHAPVDQDNVIDLAAVHPERLQDDYVNAGPMLARWGGKLADALREAGMAEVARKQGEAKLALRVRHDLSNRVEGGKPLRVTEAMIEQTMVGEGTYSKQWEALQLREIEAEANLARVKTEVEALRVKANMTIQLGSDVRKERGLTDMRLLDPSAAAADTARQLGRHNT